MRLLKVDNGRLTLETFVNLEIAPKYVTLSHVWGTDEVTYQDMVEGKAEDKDAFTKILNFARQATTDGYQYIWIDTCCINKTDPFELQETITSMKRIYQNSSITYAYLADVPTRGISWKQAFRNSRWFTRGWTLQELLAPARVEFYNTDWHHLGSKSGLADHISDITSIPIPILTGGDWRTCSIAQRMSWAANRQTTRAEDVAYCLIGLFDADMLLNYGEGKRKAFRRLQESIIKNSPDQSIFAWKHSGSPNENGFFAPCPAAFKESGNIVPSLHRRKLQFEMTNMGLKICLPLSVNQQSGLEVATLDCMDSKTGARIGIYLQQIEDDEYYRTQLPELADLGQDSQMTKPPLSEYKWIYMTQEPLTSDLPSPDFQTAPGSPMDVSSPVLDTYAQSSTPISPPVTSQGATEPANSEISSALPVPQALTTYIPSSTSTVEPLGNSSILTALAVSAAIIPLQPFLLKYHYYPRAKLRVSQYKDDLVDSVSDSLSGIRARFS